MCNEPVMRAPFKGWAEANSSRMAIKPGISVSAIFDFFTAPFGQGQIGHHKIGGVQGLDRSVHVLKLQRE